MKRAPQVLSLLALAALTAAALAERPGDFRVIGPGGGGAMFYPAVSPHDPNVVVVACDMTGAYITHNAGESWRMFNLRHPVHSFVFDPLDARTLYALTNVLWRSSDSGESWKLAWPPPAAIRGIQMSSDHADEEILADPDPLGTISALAIDPADSRVLIAAAKRDGGDALFISHDGGGSWMKETALTETPKRIWVDPRSPRNSRELYVAGAHGVMVRRDGEWRTRRAPDGVSFTDISAGFPQSGAPIFYATSRQGGFVSRDGATTWTTLLLPGAGAEVRAIATSLHHPDVAYVSYGRLALDGRKWQGVARTRDAGRTWTLVWKEAETAAPNVHDAWITERLGPDWGENPLTLTVADQDPNLCYGTDFGRTMRSNDGGENWTAVYSRRVPDGGWTSTGLDVTTNYGFHFDPFDARRRFITYTDIGLFRSEDSGRSWTRSMDGVPKKWSNTAYWIVFDPDIRGRVWGVMSGTHDLPRPKMWRRNSVLNYQGGVCRSDDGGRTWTPSNKGMPDTAPTHIVLDPASPRDRRVLYVAAMGRGVYKSADGGVTWALKNAGISGQNPLAWRMALGADNVLYAVIARRSEDGSIGNSGDGAIYRSSDGAETWQPVALPAGVNGPNGLAIDPSDPQRLYLAAWARKQGLHGEGGGIFLSVDAGRTWRNVLDRDRHVYDITIDPRDAGVLYASGFESSAWRSTDRGEHWTRIPGFNFKWGHRVIPDPEDPLRVYVTTFGGSVWHGAVNGPDRPLDIATPEMFPGR